MSFRARGRIGTKRVGSSRRRRWRAYCRSGPAGRRSRRWPRTGPSRRSGPSCSPTCPPPSGCSPPSPATVRRSCSRASNAPSGGAGTRSSPAIPAAIVVAGPSRRARSETSCASSRGRRRRRRAASRGAAAIARSLRAPRVPELPSLTGGLMGYLSYEAAALLDGHPAPDPGRGTVSADRADGDRPGRGVRPLAAAAAPGRARRPRRLRRGGGRARGPRRRGSRRPAPPPLAGRSGPGAPGDAPASPTWPTSATGRSSARFKEHILAGDIFQGVPSRRVSFPAPEGGFPDLPAAPRHEPRPVHVLRADARHGARRLLARAARAGRGAAVTSRPIAGTRPRGETEVRDRLLEHELLADPKEQAEHAMLVDLARNDLGRVCVPGQRPADRADGRSSASRR